MVVVIGSGAGGGTVSHELARKGIDVVCLEAGGRLVREDFVDDPAVMDRRTGWHDERRGARVWLCKTVGGTTTRWSGFCLRFLAHELRARTVYGTLDGTTLIDWPFALEELEPYYDRAEMKMAVSGTHDFPPSPETGPFQVIAEGARRIGYRDIRTGPLAACVMGVRWSPLHTEIPQAEETGHFELRTDSMAVRIETDDRGRATRVIYRDNRGALHAQCARAVCVAGNVVETTRLLLLSESSRFPQGLANGSGHLGRNYMRHMSPNVAAIMPGPVHPDRGKRGSGVVLDEHRHDPKRGFAGGYIIEVRSWFPGGFAQLAGWGDRAGRWMEGYTHSAAVGLVGEDPPQAENRIRLHATDRDEAGLPLPVLEYARHANTDAMSRHGVLRSRELLASLGGIDIRDSLHLETASCHNLGVARMSADPDDGVTNRWGQTHEVPNLFVTDGSLFPTSGAVNPTLTIVALAIRQADHITERMSRKDL